MIKITVQRHQFNKASMKILVARIDTTANDFAWIDATAGVELGTCWNHWLGIGAIGLPDQSTGAGGGGVSAVQEETRC